MSDRERGRTSARFARATSLAIAAVFAVALAGLVASVSGHDALEDHAGMVGIALGPILPFVILLGALVLALARSRAALLVPGALAPLAALTPWTLAPTHIGLGLGSLPFFVAWLTRHPTIAGVNHEVLLGIGAVLGTCAIPSWTALYVARTDAPRARVVVVLAALQLVAYAPVLLRLDVELLAFGLLGHATDDTAWTERLGSGLVFAGGAMARALATASTLALAGFVAWRARAARRNG